ncbi:MAG: host-nuclease inhibitor Gam family protein [Sporomusaceae bacterium]|nr:host-nuclease inhibitor Gam family protein [Sporomusaceae bacterium]
MDVTESLDQFLDEQLLDRTEDAPDQKFVIDTDEKANWAIRKIQDLQKKNQNIDELADTEINKISTWRDKEKENNESSISFFLEKLRPYAVLHLTGKSKTVSFPAGKISFRSADPKFYIGGQEVNGKNELLIGYVRQTCPDLIKTEEKADWTAFKETLAVTSQGKVISGDGEILDFIVAIEQPDKMTVKELK